MIIDQPWADPRIQRIVRGLLARSQAGEIEWQQFVNSARGGSSRTSRGKPDGYSYSTDSATVVVGSADGDGQLPLYMDVLDSSGTTVESVETPPRQRLVRNSEGIATREPAPSEVLEFIDNVRELYTIARRRGLRTDEVLDQLALELEP
jgi:hypothetical protein